MPALRRPTPLARRVLLPAALLSLPLVLGGAAALRDSVVHSRDAPIVGLLGRETYERLLAGEITPYHYYGNRLRAPDFTLPDHRGRPWRLREQRGKLVILNFWSVHCPPCVREMPTLVRLAHRLRGRNDVVLATVSIDRGWSEVASLFDGEPPFPVLFDPERKVVTGKFGTRLFPETWFIDARGVVRLRYDGPFDWSQPLVLDLVERLR